MTLEAEISELQRENARVESQMIKLKSDINAMENHLGHSEKVSINSLEFLILNIEFAIYKRMVVIFNSDGHNRKI